MSAISLNRSKDVLEHSNSISADSACCCSHQKPSRVYSSVHPEANAELCKFGSLNNHKPCSCCCPMQGKMDRWEVTDGQLRAQDRADAQAMKAMRKEQARAAAIQLPPSFESTVSLITSSARRGKHSLHIVCGLPFSDCGKLHVPSCVRTDCNPCAHPAQTSLNPIFAAIQVS